MTMTDWTDKKNGPQMYLSTTHIEGVKSLRIDQLVNDYGIKTLDQSETDSPKHVNVEFWLKQTQDAEMAHFFRYQDLNNYYSVILEQDDYSMPYLRVYLALREAGNLDKGTYACRFLWDMDWDEFRIEFCEIAGTVYMYFYRKESGNWVLKGEKARAPAKFTGGGAYGVGFEDITYSSESYLDTTKVYY